MSVRIHNDVISAGTGLDVGRTGAASSPTSGSTRGITGSGTSGGDHIDISRAAETIAAGVSTSNLEQAARVKNLSALYSSGQYSVDSGKVSKALVDNSLSGAAGL